MTRHLLERDLQKKCVRHARERGFWARKFTAAGRRSAPDYIFARNGKIFFVEFKRLGEKPTPLQLEEHKEMLSYGLTVYVIDNYDDFKNLIDLV